MRASCLVFGVLLAGCSSSDFSVAADAGPTDTGSSTDTGVVADSGGTDSGVAETSTDGAVDAPPCVEGPANPAIVYVDKRATRPGKGTLDCPFQTIKDAVALVATLPTGSGAHTLRVAGGTGAAPLVYDEPVLILKYGWTLLGDGAGRVTITGGGKCGDSQCLVVMEGGSALEGVRLDALGKVMTPLGLTPGAFTSVVVKSTVVTGVKSEKVPAVYVEGTGNAEFGPDVRVIDNAGIGIAVKNVFRLKFSATAGLPNQINKNGFGIALGGGVIELGGPTEVSSNVGHGVLVQSPDKGTHNFDGLSAKNNGLSGLYLEVGASARVRRSTFLRNKVGITFKSAPGSELDLGKLLDPGNNVLGGKTDSNATAAICSPVARALDMPAWNDAFKACAPSTAPIDATKSCDELGSYQDIWFAVATGSSKAPFDVQNCTVGP
ncbi:MAG: hypothetical protein IPJ34_34210 [Myxococcales bacterium]|nr:hypothetical protein [Myxococcales bacterium]